MACSLRAGELLSYMQSAIHGRPVPKIVAAQVFTVELGHDLNPVRSVAKNGGADSTTRGPRKIRASPFGPAMRSPDPLSLSTSPTRTPESGL